MVTSTALATNFLGFGFGGFSTPRIERHSESEDTATLLLAIVVGVAGAAAPVALRFGPHGRLAGVVDVQSPEHGAPSRGLGGSAVVTRLPRSPRRPRSPSAVEASGGEAFRGGGKTRVAGRKKRRDARTRGNRPAGKKNASSKKTPRKTSPDAARGRRLTFGQAPRARRTRAALRSRRSPGAASGPSRVFRKRPRRASSWSSGHGPGVWELLGFSRAGTVGECRPSPGSSMPCIEIDRDRVGAFARARILAFAASLAGRTCFALVDFAAVAARTCTRGRRRTPSLLCDIACHASSPEGRRGARVARVSRLHTRPAPSSRTSAERRFVFAKAFAVTIAAIAASRVAYPIRRDRRASWFGGFPQQLTAFRGGDVGKRLRRALVFLPAGPGSVERAFKRGPRALESFGRTFGSFHFARREDREIDHY